MLAVFKTVVGLIRSRVGSIPIHLRRNISAADKKLDNHLLKSIPSISRLLSSETGKKLCAEFGEGAAKLEFRNLTERLRQEIQSGRRDTVPQEEELLPLVHQRLLRLTSPLGRKAINATGILLHTGLGRGPLAQSAVNALAMAGCYSVVQVDLETGERSLREAKIEQMLRELTGCEAATVVNNNAAATFISLNVLALGKEVIVSRGHLIEIGGSFRMPDVMAQSGAILREVGTTNRTHLRDYEGAIGENTGALLHVHPSNYKIHGFAGTPELSELCALGNKHSLPVMADLGSGAITPLDKYGLRDCMTIGQALAAGAEITCSSGDKLICGPQAGIICGSKRLIAKIRKNPFARMFRVGSLTLSSLEATLLHYLNGTQEKEIPLYQMLSLTDEDLQQRGEQLLGGLENLHGIQTKIVSDSAFVGGGSLPDQAVQSKAVSLELLDSSRRNAFAQDLSKTLRFAVPPVFCRIKEEAVLFNLRSLMPGDLELLIANINAAVKTLAVQ